ncbi:hypothetical protein ABT337_24820 [Saccharopolyspora hirsuta]|uniref:Maleylacetate reductase n=1 Tax=Saccharopolyspora hirsuta TaxID=1837 RepID=A0A5M7B8G2_SACHI|nr:maleylacetate reductase [Saccharopolyspora hirsuta]KAA5825863.1 maleylacetate reductase [Saccharopolyspora hirsuta]
MTEQHAAPPSWCALPDLPIQLSRHGLHAVVVVCRAPDVPGLGPLLGLLGGRAVAVFDEVRGIPTPAAVFALADVVGSSGADGVLSVGAAAHEMAKALVRVLPVPTAVVAPERSYLDDRWSLFEHGRLTTGTDARARPAVLCCSPRMPHREPAHLGA